MKNPRPLREKIMQVEKPAREKYPFVTEVTEAEHIDMVREIFSTITGKYDFLNHFLSLRRDIAWRLFSVRKMRFFSTYRLLDVATGTAEKMDEAMESFARNFIKKTGVYDERIDELTLFPREHLDEESIILLISDAFGFDRFDNVFMANYTLENTELTAFLSVRRDSSEASELVVAYQRFLIANGGVDVKSGTEIPGAKLVEILDTFELIFSHGRFLAGVHAAEDKGHAERLAVTLMQKLSGAGA